jgi:hypothetical protein
LGSRLNIPTDANGFPALVYIGRYDVADEEERMTFKLGISFAERRFCFIGILISIFSATQTRVTQRSAGRRASLGRCSLQERLRADATAAIAELDFTSHQGAKHRGAGEYAKVHNLIGG